MKDYLDGKVRTKWKNHLIAWNIEVLQDASETMDTFVGGLFPFVAVLSKKLHVTI